MLVLYKNCWRERLLISRRKTNERTQNCSWKELFGLHLDVLAWVHGWWIKKMTIELTSICLDWPTNWSQNHWFTWWTQTSKTKPQHEGVVKAIGCTSGTLMTATGTNPCSGMSIALKTKLERERERQCLSVCCPSYCRFQRDSWEERRHEQLGRSLNEVKASVGQVYESHGSRRREGRSSSLNASNNPLVSSVLFYWHDKQVPDSLSCD